MLYFASPYSHPEASVREYRYHAACRATAMLIRQGLTVYSPIVHSHPLVAYGLPTDWNYWERVDREILALSDVLLILMLDGWQESEGVRAEIRIARELGLPIDFLAEEKAPPYGKAKEKMCG